MTKKFQKLNEKDQKRTKIAKSRLPPPRLRAIGPARGARRPYCTAFTGPACLQVEKTACRGVDRPKLEKRELTCPNDRWWRRLPAGGTVLSHCHASNFTQLEWQQGVGVGA